MPNETSSHFVLPRQATPDGNRRHLLGLLAASPLLLLGLAREARAQTAAVCVNLENMPPAESALRKELGFHVTSPDPAKQCAGCAFFTSTASDCGSCQILNNGPVTPHSVCDSWAAKG